MLVLLTFTASFLLSQVWSQDTRGTFKSPKTGIKWRYWIEDASAEPEVLRKDVSEMARVGSSGFELLSYQSYGGFNPPSEGHVLVDPTDVAFGSDAFVDATKTLVQAAKDNGVTIDFSMGPNQGAGVPVHPDEIDQEGWLTELVFGSHFLNPGESFSGPLPDPVIVPFVDAEGIIRSANATQKFLVAVIGAQLVQSSNTTSSRVSLDFGTVVDLTDQVRTSDGSSTISWAPDTNATSVLLAYYYRRSGFPEAVGGFNGPIDGKPGSWGSFVVDHFAAQGANVSASFIEKYIFSKGGIGELLREPGVGGYVWEDSMEFRAQVWWTPGFPDRFRQRHGYSINKMLPILHALFPAGPGSLGLGIPQTFDYGTTTRNTWAFAEDYRDTLTSLYIDYLSAFNQWAESVGLQFSNQPGYNFEIDVAASAAIPAVPEIESLALFVVDEARQVSGGVHLGNKRILSSETGARFGQAMTYTMHDMLEDCKNQFAGHVNLIMLHGYSYSGRYPTGTTWPGLNAFPYHVSDNHGPRMPAWDHYPGYLAHLARNQYVLQSGVAKVDIALYRKGYNVNTVSPFPSNSLNDAGYTYEYVSPENFKLPGVNVKDHRLAIDGPAYKALLLNRIQNITVDGAQHILDFAKGGLPVVIAGGIPRGTPGFDPTGTQVDQTQSILQELVALPVVRVVDDENAVSDALSSLNVRPAAVITPSSLSFYSIRRDETSIAGTRSHFFIYNQNGEAIVDVTLTLAAEGTPFILDAWSGEISPVAIWNTSEDGRIVIPGVSLASHESALFTIISESSLEGVPAPSVHVSQADASIFGHGSSNGVELRSFKEGTSLVQLSNGLIHNVEFSLEGETTRELSGWQLNITSWTPPVDIVNDVDSVLIPQAPIQLTQGLVPWNELPGHGFTSGVGTYMTTFDWAHAQNSSVGAQLDLGVVVHTLRVWVNGMEIPTADPTLPVVDISSFVQEGTNTLRVDAASTLNNVLNSVSEVKSLGVLRPTDGASQQYGLIEPVRLIPYARTTISF